MIEAGEILGKLKPYQAKKILIKHDQHTGDIIREILQAHQEHSHDYDQIAANFWKGSVKKTAKFIFDFLKKNVKYSIEPDTRQSVKSPAAILATGNMYNGGNDCKHYSLFAAGILDALNRKGHRIKFCFRFSNYKLFSDTPHHVFVVIKNRDGSETWIDPVLSSFDQKKPYINKIDRCMPLYKISGIGCNGKPCNCTPGVIRETVGGIEVISGRRKAKKSARKAKRKERRTRLYCKGALAKKIALAPARGAFLAIVRLNVKKTAVKLFRSLQDPERKKRLSRKWCRLGGSFRKLEQAINKGAAKYNRRNQIKGMEDPAMIGVPLATMLAAAAPILAALREFLGSAQEIKDQAQNLFSSGGSGGSGGSEYQETANDESFQDGESVGEIGTKQIIYGIGAVAILAALTD